MSIVLLLISCSLGVATLFAAAFLWSVRTGQFDDLDGDSVRLLVNQTDAKNSNDIPSNPHE